MKQISKQLDDVTQELKLRPFITKINKNTLNKKEEFDPVITEEQSLADELT